MIDEEATFKKFGYYSTDLTPKSHKKIIAVCDDCGKVRIVKKQNYRTLCTSCVCKGERNACFGKKGEDHPSWKGGEVQRICEFCGAEFPAMPANIKIGGGRFCTKKCYGKWIRGENNPSWKNGASFEPYCSKWNESFREYIRDKFGRVCFLCPKTEEENGQRLSVHHVNGNKNCGCDDDETCQFVPLCAKCHSKVHSKKVDWEKRIKDKMRNSLKGWVI